MNQSGNMSGGASKKGDLIPGIECDVTDCMYNEGQHKCYASKIQVGPMHASSKDDTKCATFEQKSGGGAM